MPNRLSRLLKLVGSYLVSSIQGIGRAVVIIISLIVCLPCFLGCILIVLMLGMIPFFLMWKYGNIPQDETSMLISAIIYIAPLLIASILNLIIYTLDTFFQKREEDIPPILYKIRKISYVAVSVAVCSVLLVMLFGYTKQKRLENTVELRVAYTVTNEYNNHVGNEWEFDAYVNDEKITSDGKVITYVCGRPLKFTSKVTEFDISLNDIGEVSKKVSFKRKELNTRYTQNVVVFEQRGPYAGNRAKFRFDYSLTVVRKPSEKDLKYKYATSEVWHKYKHLFKDRDVMENVLQEKHSVETIPADTSLFYLYATDSLWGEYKHLFINRDAMEKCLRDTWTHKWIEESLKSHKTWVNK